MSDATQNANGGGAAAGGPIPAEDAKQRPADQNQNDRR